MVTRLVIRRKGIDKVTTATTSKGDAGDDKKVRKWVEMKFLLKGQLFQRAIHD
jgi:hypothetical protein